MVGVIVLLSTLTACVTPWLSTQGAVIGSAQAAGADGAVRSEGPSSSAATLRVVTYNMLHGFADRENDRTLDARLDLLANELARLRPDVILLQEASTTPGTRHRNVVDTLRTRLNEALSPDGLAYNSIYYAAHGSRIIGFYEGSAILSLHPIVDHEKLTYSAQSRTPPERRIAVRATINVHGTEIDFYSTHLTNQDEVRREVPVVELQARELSDVVSRSADTGRLVIIGGDFNAPPDSVVVASMLAAGAQDAWSHAAPGTPGGTSLRGSISDSSAEFGRRIDYIFIAGEDLDVSAVTRILDLPLVLDSPGVDEATAIPLWPSDHAGVMAEIRYR